jgi:hypothetical protein
VQYADKSSWKNVQLNANGIVYLNGQKFNIDGSSAVTLNTGSIIADSLLPDHNSILSVTGEIGSASSAQSNLKKQGYTNIPVLVQ